MKINISRNPKHASDRWISFLEVLAASGNYIEFIYTKEDLKNDEKPTLENLGASGYIKKLANKIVYQNGNENIVLYEKVNIVYQRKETMW
jgi:hypothetical protein